MNGDIEKEPCVVQQFMWKDGEHKCEAGKLLFALMKLTEAENHVSSNDDKSVSQYLVDKGLVEVDQEDASLHLIESRYDEAVELGNQISDHIGAEIESLPVDINVQLLPSIHLMAIPLPVFKNQEEPQEQKNEESKEE